jgi:hypothetical protein
MHMTVSVGAVIPRFHNLTLEIKMKTFSMTLIAAALLSACGGGNDGPPPMTSATERAVIVSVRDVKLRVQHDAAMTDGVAYVTYMEPVPGMGSWLNLNRDVIPAVERATGCRYRGGPMPDNQIMGDMGVGNVPISC